MKEITMRPIAHICSDFPTKFGVPRQSGLAGSLSARVIFEKEYRIAEAVRGLEDFSHIWLIWYFSEAAREGWTPTVRPPRLGGNRRMGVFATRSPFRPNSMGLSAVRLISIERDAELGPVLCVAGADLMDGTPIFDIKPYLPFADAIPNASGGFAGAISHELQVDIAPELLCRLPEEKRAALLEVLRGDPRPGYHDDPARRYGFAFAGREVGFVVRGGVLTVVSVEEI